MIRRWLDRLRGRDIAEELDHHIAARAGELESAGLPPAGAQAEAHRRFGSRAIAFENTRRVHLREWIESLGQDLSYAARGFARSPVFTLTAVAAIALGIGATTAVFSVVDRVLFRSLPYPNEHELAWFGVTAPIGGGEFMLGPDYLAWKREATPFQAMTSTAGEEDCDLTNGDPVRLRCAKVEANFLATFGMHPAIGRDFTPEDDLPGPDTAALLTHSLWRTRFGADPAIAGKSIQLDGRPVKVAGVLPADFELPTLADADILLPQKLDPAQSHRGAMIMLAAFARMKPGVNTSQARTALEPLFQESLKTVPPNFRKEVGLRVYPLRERQIRDTRITSWVLFGAVAALLAIACANVANLLLARAAGRRREMAVRAAIGASRVRLVRQTLTEGLLLGAVGGIAGVLLGAALLQLLIALAPDGIPRLRDAAIDGRILAFAATAAIASGALFGLAPALETARPETLTGSRTAGVRRMFLRQSLVAAQLAASVVLLTGAGLLLRSLWNIQRVELGLRTAGVVTAQVALNRDVYQKPEARLQFAERLEAGLRRLPGVAAVALADRVPPSGGDNFVIYNAIEVEGRPRIRESTGGMVAIRVVTPGYFAVLGIPIRRGRGFTDADRTAAGEPVIISEALARRKFPGEDPIGKRIRIDPGPWQPIVGIAADVKNAGLIERDSPEFYRVMQHKPAAARRSITAVVSAAGPGIAALIAQEIRSIDPSLPVDTATLDSRVRELSSRQRFQAALIAAFALIGVSLAAIGLYGVISFLVAQRTQEIGVRLALGATPSGITRLILTRALLWTVAGAAAGLCGAIWAARFLKTMLYNIEPADPLTLTAVVVGLVTVALASAWLPSRRASRLDPMLALRHE